MVSSKEPLHRSSRRFFWVCVCGSARKLYDLCALQVIWSGVAGPVQANEPFEASSLFAKSRPAAHRTSISINFRFNCLCYSVAMDTSRRINFFFVHSNQTEALDHFGSFTLDAIWQSITRPSSGSWVTRGRYCEREKWGKNSLAIWTSTTENPFGRATNIRIVI